MTDPTQEPITHRDVAYLANAIEGLTSVVNQMRVDNAQTFVRKDVLDPKLSALADQIDGVRADVQAANDWLKWTGRIVLGAVILAVVGLVLKGGF